MSRVVRKMVVFGVVLLAVGSPLFATTTVKVDDMSINLSFIQNAVNLIVGIFAGGYCLLKAALDIFHAVRNSSEDQNGLKKAIGGFVLNAAILGGFMFVVNFVFGKMSTAEGGKISISADEAGSKSAASNAFFGTLSGALVSL